MDGSDDPDAWEIHLAVDDGFVYGSVAMACVRKGEVPTPHTIHVLSLQRVSHDSPQVIGFSMNDKGYDKVYWGEQLLHLLSREQLDESKVVVFDNLKACLFPTPETAGIRQGIEDRLRAMPGSMTVTQLMVLFHKHKYEAIFPQLVSTLSPIHGWTADQIQTIDTRTIFTVPEMAQEDHIHNLSGILEAAGYTNAIALTETEAAGAWRSYKLNIMHHLHRLPDHPPGEVQDSYGLLVLDAGGLTFNAVEYRCFGFVADGVDVVTQPTGRCAGAACGSQATITESFIRHAKQVCEEKYGGFAACLEDLGYRDEGQFRRILAKDFDAQKPYWDEWGKKKSFHFCGRALHSSAEDFEISISVTRDQMKGWYDEAARQICEQVDKVLSPDTRIISLTGGFFTSTYLADKMRERYQHFEGRKIWMPDAVGNRRGRPDDYPVVQGALCRGVLRQQPAIASGFVLGIAQWEEYDSELHSDVKRASAVRNGYTNELWVVDRWRTLISPGELASSATSFASFLQDFRPSDDDPVLRSALFCSSRAIANHSPIYVHRDTLRYGIHKWGDTMEHTVPRAHLLKCPKLCGKRGWEDRYIVWARLTLKRAGPHGLDVSMAWELEDPQYKPQLSGEVEEEAAIAVQLGDDEVHNSRFPAFKQRKQGPNSQQGPESGPSTTRTVGNDGVGIGVDVAENFIKNLESEDETSEDDSSEADNSDDNNYGETQPKKRKRALQGQGQARKNQRKAGIARRRDPCSARPADRSQDDEETQPVTPVGKLKAFDRTKQRGRQPTKR